MSRFTRIAALALIGTAIAGTSFAQGPYTVDDADSINVLGADPNSNIVGGALTRTIGSGEGAMTEVVAVLHTQAPQAVRVVGSGENQSVVAVEAAQPVRSASTRG